MGHSHTKAQTRFSLDMSDAQHTHLKMLATKKGVSMCEYIFEALAFKEAAEGNTDTGIEIDNSTFREGLKRMRKERYQLAQNLSKR